MSDPTLGTTATSVGTGTRLDEAQLKRVMADIEHLRVKVYLGEHDVPDFPHALHFDGSALVTPQLDGQLVLVPRGESERWHRELEALGCRVTRWPAKPVVIFAESFRRARFVAQALELRDREWCLGDDRHRFDGIDPTKYRVVVVPGWDRSERVLIAHDWWQQRERRFGKSEVIPCPT